MHRANGSLDGGFSLIEMMIVVAIIAVLASVAFVAYQRHLRSGRLVEAQEFVARITGQQEIYKQRIGYYADVSPNGKAYPALSSGEPKAKPWTSSPQRWKDFGIAPAGNVSYFSFYVRASIPPNHPLYYSASNAIMGIPAQPSTASGLSPHPWYYIIAMGDLDGDSSYTNGYCSNIWTTTKCTLMTASSAKNNVIVRNGGS